MKVFAHYMGNEKDWNLSEDGFQYRWRTLLKFGDSWNVIGSVIMKNPGSAQPLKSEISKAESDALATFDNSKHPWYRFTADNTMQLIEKLFVARDEGKPLNGVIQIFNLFNIRNADLEAALMSSKEAKESVLSTIDEDIEAMRRFASPIYTGWGSLGKYLHFKEQAEKIFQFVRGEMKQEYLFPEFETNRFYHPQYLMGRGKNKPISQSIIKSFCKNSCEMNHVEAFIPSIETISGKEVMDYMKKASEQELWYENIRYRFYPGLQVTFDKKTVNIRFAYKKNNGFSIADYNNPDEKNTIELLAGEFGYTGPEKVWIGRKKYSDFGHDAQSIARNICDELNRISMALRNSHIEL